MRIIKFNNILVIGALLFCLVSCNKQQYLTSENVGSNESYGTESNNTVNNIVDMLEKSANWLSEGEYDHIKNGEDGEPANESDEDNPEGNVKTLFFSKSIETEDGSTNASFPEAAIKEQIIYNDSKMEIASVSLKREKIDKDNQESDKTWDDLVLTVDILNKENEEEIYLLNNFVVLVNDCITVPAYLSQSIMAGDKATVEIGIDTTYLNNFGISRIGDIKFRIEKYNSNFENPFVTEYIDVPTSLCDQADTVLFLENAQEFYIGNGISIKGRYVDSFSSHDLPGLLMLIDNNTAYDLSVEVEDITVNNTMQEWYSFDAPVEVIRGTKAIWFSHLDPEDWERLTIEELDEIIFSLDIKEKETYDPIVKPWVRLKKSNDYKD